MAESGKGDNGSDEQRGLRCRRCGGQQFRVIDTRAALDGKVIRRRECRICGSRMTTWERAIGGG